MNEYSSKKEVCGRHKRCMDAIRSGWTPDSRKVTNVHKTYITDHAFHKRSSGRLPPPSTPDYTAAWKYGRPSLSRPTFDCIKLINFVEGCFPILALHPCSERCSVPGEGETESVSR